MKILHDVELFGVYALQVGQNAGPGMAESIQEDLYSLGKAKELVERLHNDYVHNHPNTGEKYKEHLGEVVKHLADAIKERASQEGILWRW